MAKPNSLPTQKTCSLKAIIAEEHVPIPTYYNISVNSSNKGNKSYSSWYTKYCAVKNFFNTTTTTI